MVVQGGTIFDKNKVKEFHAWECISLIRCFSTLDFVIKDEGHMAALFNYTWRKVYG